MKRILQEAVSCVIICAGALLASFAVACILLPNDAIDYGTAGIAIIINKLSGFNLSVCVFCTFLPFLIAGLVFMGKLFTLKALVGSLAYTAGLALFEKLSYSLNTEHFLAVVFGGAILGVGLSLILRQGGCIDGSEILASILINRLSAKTGKNYSMTNILIIFNVCVYIAVFLLLDMNSAMMSLLVYIVATAIIDHFTNRFEAIKQVTIITKEPEKLISDLRAELNKTCTIISSQGAIAGENKTLICYVNYFELQRLREIIDKNKGTFSTISTIDEIIH